MIHLICIVVFRRGLTFYLARFLFNLEVGQRTLLFAIYRNWHTEYKRQYLAVETNQHTQTAPAKPDQILSDKTATMNAYDAT